MPLTPQQPALQRSTLTLYGELLCRRSDWGGELVFSAFPGAAATGLSAAASLAGAASLIVDSDIDSVRAHNRDGAFDFVVTTLDEALRALKNEIRLHRPIAIALTADPSAVTEEAVERGLSPRLLLSSPPPASPRTLPATFNLVSSPDQLSPSVELSAWLAERHWSAAEVPALSPALAGKRSPSETLPDAPHDAPRRTWLRHLPTHQRSARGSRWLWLTPEEIQELAP